MFTYSIVTDKSGATICINRDDGLSIPPDPNNRDYAEYTQWIAAGNTPAQVPPPDPKIAIQAQIDQIERDTLMNRGAREGWMDVIRDKASSMGITDDATIASQNPFFAKLLQVDDQVRSLRAQL